MNRQPVSYLQTDPRWKAIPYAVKGEASTIGGSGCGPTAMAMILATWADPKVTPATECAWALAHGFKALKHGTYYGYFTPAARRYGLSCTQLNGTTLYGNAGSGVHAQVLQFLAQGDLIIACMGPGLWTRSGHFVLVYGVKDGVVYINDPASTRAARVRGSWSTFRRQVKFYWRVRRPATVSGSDTAAKKEEPEMTTLEIRTLVEESIKVALANERKSILDEVRKMIAASKEEIYDTVEDVPEDWYLAREAVQAAVDSGALQGTGDGKLGMTESFLRYIITDYRGRKAREMGME